MKITCETILENIFYRNFDIHFYFLFLIIYVKIQYFTEPLTPPRSKPYSTANT